MAKSQPTALEDTQSRLSVQTIDSAGNAPDRRIATVDAAWGAYTQSRNANMLRDRRFADIAGINAGFPPTPASVAERNGLCDMPNLNTKQFESKVKTYASNVTAITAKGDGWFSVEMEHDDPVEAKRRSECVTDYFNSCLKRWETGRRKSRKQEYGGFSNGSQYILETAARDMQMALFGIGVALFPDRIDFRWKTIPTRRVLVPENVRISLSNCPALFIEDEISVTELYSMRKKEGWSEASILRNLYDRVEVMSQTAQRRFTFAEWVSSIQKNDQWLISDFQPVRIVHVYTMEFDQTISHSIFTDQNNLTANASDANTKAANEKNKDYIDANGFIYDEKGVADCWQEALILFADNAGPEGYYHGIKGFGDLIYDGCHLNNLMFNRAAIGAIMKNILMFHASNENDVQKLDQVVFTLLGIMYPGLELEQVRFEADVEAALSIVGYGTQIMDTNARIFPQNDKTRGGEQPTATQINFDRADQAQFTGLQIDLYRAIGLDPLGAEMYWRIAQPASKYPESWGGGMVAKQFRDLCKKAGIPEEDLLKVRSVKANRNGGTGNLGMDVWKADQMLTVATPGQGQRNAQKMKAAALVGYENVPAYVEDMPEQTPEDIQIGNENLFIQSGKTPEAFGDQNQQLHLESHMQLAAQLGAVAARFDEHPLEGTLVQDAQKINDALAAAIEHSGLHVQLMSEPRRGGKEPAMFEEMVKVATKNLQNLSQIQQKFGERIQEAQQAQNPNSGMSPEMMKAQQEMQIRQAEAQQEMALKQQAHDAKLGNLAVTAQARTEMKLTGHQVDLALKSDAAREQDRTKTAETIVDLHHKSLAARQELETQAEKDKLAIEAAKKKAATAKKPTAKKK